MLHQGIILREGHITRTIYNLVRTNKIVQVKSLNKLFSGYFGL